MIADIIIILIIILFLLLGIRRGAARTLLNIAAVAASAILSHLLASAAAEAIYNAFFKQAIVGNIQNIITQNGEKFLAQNSVEALPDNLRGFMGFFTGLFGVRLEELQGRLVPSSAQTEQLARSVEEAWRGLALCVLTVLLSIVIFFVLMIVFKLLIRLVAGVFEIPVIRQVNRILGALLGAVEGFIFVCILVNVFYIVLSYTDPISLENGKVFGSLFHALTFFT